MFKDASGKSLTIYQLSRRRRRAKDQRLALRAESTDPIEWSCQTLDCQTEGNRATVGLQEGRHQILARDTATGETATTWIEVEQW
jgi:hypothetical protein